MSKGMDKEQKIRLANYMDEFKSSNGGCLLCGEKITEHDAYPEVTGDSAPRLFLYGTCKEHARQQNIDKVTEKILLNCKAESDDHQKAKIVVIDLKVQPETRKFQQ